MTRIFKIGGTDYGPAGLGTLVSCTPEPCGPGKIGQGTAALRKAAGGYSLLPLMEVEDYEWNGSAITATYYAGFIGKADTDELPGARPPTKTWDLPLQDQNRLLTGLVGPAAWAQAIRFTGASFPSFAAQVAHLVSLLTSGASKSIDATSQVVDLVHTGMPDQFFQGQTLNAMLLKLCGDARALNPALHPAFYIGPDRTVPRATFGGPVLYLYDQASPPAPSMSFSDAPTGGQKTIFLPDGHPRSLDAAALVQYRQGIHQATGAVYTAFEAASIATYPNPYDPQGAWKGEVLVTTEATAGAGFQAKLAASVAATAYPRETLQITTDAVPPPYPGDWVDVTLALEGLSAAVYQVAASSIEFPANNTGLIRSHLALGLQKLLLGDDPTSGGAVPPIVRDVVPPDTPGSFALASNVYNWTTDLADLTFTWADSVAGDLDYYVVEVAMNGGTSRQNIPRGTLTAVFNLLTGIAFSANIWAVDTSTNASAPNPAAAIPGTTATGSVPAKPTWPVAWNPENTYDAATNTTRVRVEWDANAGGDHVLQYRVLVADDATQPRIFYLDSGTTTLLLPDEIPNVYRAFVVFAINRFGTSAVSDTQTLITDYEPPNVTPLFPINGSFEIPTSADSTLPADWSILHSNSGGSVTRTQAGGASAGKWALALTYIGFGGGTSSATSHAVDSSLFEAGQQYRYSVDYYYVSDPGVAQWTLTLFAFDKSGTVVGSTAKILDHTVTAWGTASDVWTIPATTTYLNMRVAHSGTTTLTSTVYVDNVRVARLNTTDDLQDGSITTAKIAAGAVTATELASNAVTAAKIAANVVANSHLQYGSPVAQSGATGSRPGSPVAGQTYLDTTIHKPIWYTGSAWVDATGTVV